MSWLGTAGLGAALALAIPATAQTHWPGFLSGHRPDATDENLPLRWSPTENVAWQAALPGHGQSSPIVWGDRVFVTAVEGPNKDTYYVLALDLETGKLRWRYALESSDKVPDSYFVSRAAPTPITDGQAVYAFFESGDAVALGFDGNVRWRRSLSQDYGRFVNEHGLAASPVQTEQAVIVLVDHGAAAYLIALDKKDGRTLWKTDRAPRRSWSSPALVPVQGKWQVVCSSSGSVDGYDPQTGERLWSYDDVAGNTAATPLPFGEGLFLVGASPGREGGARVEGARKSNFAARVVLVDGKPGLEVLWRNEQSTPSFASPVVYRGHAYWINTVGVVHCFDAASGELRYAQRISQSCWATPLGRGERLYCFGKDGLTSVLRAGPRFELLAENQLWDPATVRPDPAKAATEKTEERRRAAAAFSGRTVYGVAAVPGTLLVRTGDVLYCLRQP
jgi:outer membrane protein assembly factor BamB